MAIYSVKYVLRVLFTILSYKGIDMGEREENKRGEWEDSKMGEWVYDGRLGKCKDKRIVHYWENKPASQQ